MTAKQHCGKCGRACAGTATCQNGHCVSGGTYREVRRWAGNEGGLELIPFGIAIDQADIIYVTDFQIAGQVWRFSASGEFIETWSTGAANPSGIEISRSGVVYVAHTDDPGLVQTFSRNGSPGLSFGTDDSPNGLAIGHNGDVYVACPVLSLVQRFTADGTLIETWEAPGYDFGFPHWVATAPTGDVYVSDLIGFDQQVRRFSASGTLEANWALQGTLTGPVGITVDGAGFVYIVDGLNNQVQKFTANGDFVGAFGDDLVFEDAVDVAVSRSGMVYVSDFEGQVIVQFEPA